MVAVAGILLLGAACLRGTGTSGSRAQGPVRTTAAFASVLITSGEGPSLSIVAPIPGSIVLRPGETTIFGAIAFDQFGGEIPGPEFQWSVQDQSAGTITPTGIFQAGNEEGVFVGAVVVRAIPPPGFASGTAQGSVDVVVSSDSSERIPTSMRLFPSVPETGPSQSLFLSAIGMAADGTLLPSNQPRWEMVDERAGEVSTNGRFTAGEFPGSYPRAILVKLSAGREGSEITALMDVLITEASTSGGDFSLAILPQAVSLTLGQEFFFNAVALDLRNGKRLDELEVKWSVLDQAAGNINGDGRFRASSVVGLYADSVEAQVTLPGPSGATVTTRATVALVDSSDPPGRSNPQGLLSLFPTRVVLSPGDSTKLGIVGVDADGRRLAGADVEWLLDPALGNITKSARLTAGESPGLHRDAIQAIVSIGQDGQVTTRRISADLIIRGPLARVVVRPASVRVNQGGLVSFFASAQDAAGTFLPDVTYEWSMAEPAAGTIDSSGTFAAGQGVGNHPNAVRVVAVERIRSP